MEQNKPMQHRKIIQKIFDQAWTRAEFDGIDALISEDARFHFRGRTVPMNAKDLKRIVAGWHRAFGDFQFTIEEMVAEGDFVAVRSILSGNHQDVWKDIPATGKQVSVTAMMFFRFSNRQMVDIWEDYDEYGLRQQLGSVP